jgi:2-amino-4-hydroxy-6-hydroxymethyldihydropteridine diphosphokinase
MEATGLVQTSSIYEARPLGPSVTPYLNAVAELDTALGPDRLLDQLLATETRHGRVRAQAWGPRTLDLDLLLYVPPGLSQTIEIASSTLQLPHPEMFRRDFVLAPLVELACPYAIRDGQTATQLLGMLPGAQRTIMRKLPDVLEPNVLPRIILERDDCQPEPRVRYRS